MSELREIGIAARQASIGLAETESSIKNDALMRGAEALRDHRGSILDANAEDVESARRSGMSQTLLDRLTLTPQRTDAMATAMCDIAHLDDPMGELMEEWDRPNGLNIRRVRVPLGVVAVIYEARPNVTSDVAALCIKSGNAAILRGSSSTMRSNRAIVDALTPAFDSAGLRPQSLQLVQETSRESARELMRMREYIDLLIPRGGPNLISDILETATVPFVIDGDGNCHIYVDVAADLDMALAIVINAKTSRPSVCNSAEKLLVHADVAPDFLPRAIAQLQSRGVLVRGDAAAMSLVDGIEAARDDDWPREYLDLTMAIAIVDSVDGAIAHIRRYSSGHTEAIITEDIETAHRFIAGCPAAVVMVNASTRFTDGGEFGFGAEIGNSTQRLHARGPMGLRELTTYRLEVWGNGQTR